MKKYAETPLMKQYYGIKAKHPDAVLLFRVGDFYETFGEDAIHVSKILGITLTKRANGTASHVELAGFPHHALDTYLPKLVRAGQRVAICDQLEDPKLTKNIVKRGVTELVTPGISFDSNVLEHKENNFLASVYFAKENIGLAFLDVSTGEFFISEGNVDYIDKLLNSFSPKEILLKKADHDLFETKFGSKYYTYKIDEWAYSEHAAKDKLLNHFQTQSLKGFGVEGMNQGQTAAGAILFYLELTQHNKVSHISSISRIDENKYVWIDKFTIRNLEIFSSYNENAKTLLSVIDKTISPMGARLLRRWVALPLKDKKGIEDRHSVVEFFNKNSDFKEKITRSVNEIGDIERIISKVAAARANPREVVQLKRALKAIEPIKELCLNSGNEVLYKIGEQLNPCESVYAKIDRELFDEPSTQIIKGNVIANGIDDELDSLRTISKDGKKILKDIEERETKKTGITSLKISFNNVFGYYIEVRNTHKDKVPEDWVRKQTLVSAERYITDELKTYEEKILGAEEKILVLECKIYSDLLSYLISYISTVQLNAHLIAQLDCLLSFSTASEEHNYTKPEIFDNNILDIKEGRHPVIERMLPAGEEYISNDIYMDPKTQQVIMITGPNMSGKSALLRQTALIVLMAQIGSFVPAQKSKIGIVDKIFTRVGASDNISQGESTFMVEMNEAASILNNMSDRSLILLDEIGRGTSTYDGISIAWAMVEYIHEHPTANPKTLFATHYHELNEMENIFKRVKNFNVSVKELDNKVLFLRKLKSGGVAHSFGIHVARIAGMPNKVVIRAEEILKDLESNRKQSNKTKSPITSKNNEDYQLSFFQLDDPVLEQIRDKLKEINVNELTPLEALNKLNDIKKISGL